MRILPRAVGVISLIVGNQTLTLLGASQSVIRSHDLSVEMSWQGQIVGMLLGKEQVRWDIYGQTELTGCRVEGPVESEKAQDGAVRFKKKLLCDVDQTRREVKLIEVFTPTDSSVRWEMELDGKGPAWSTKIETRLHIFDAKSKKFWTTWGDPRADANVQPSWNADPSWQDPLIPTTFPDRLFWYGAPYYQYDKPRIGTPLPFRDVICIPLATILDDNRDIGLNLALSPEDVLPELTLETSANGGLTFSRLFRRISEKHLVHFALDLVAHEGDWRGGMRWMTTRYPVFFDPPLASAHRLGRTAAYSSYEGPLDAAKFK